MAATPLPRIKKGEPPGFAQADFGNKIIQAIDDLRNLTVSPDGLGKLVVGDKGVILDLTGINQALVALQSAVQTLVNNSDGGTGGTSNTALTNRVTNIENRLNAATVVCNEDGTVTLSL